MTQQAEPVQDTKQRPSTVAVRYGFLGWVGQFRHDLSLKFKYTDRVVIKTERGLEIGTPVSVSCAQTCCKFVRPEQTEAYIRCSGDDYLQRNAGEIVRVATPEDLAEQRRIDAQVKEKLAFCGLAAIKANLDMRMIACEHLLGGERIIFYFTAEGRIDFRQLVRELAREYHTRIEMRQIGARDEARIVADLEICGRECCCKNFLKVLRPVNMKMAKMQKATLDPTKVSGRCGRLRCCLRYEQQTYEELDSKLPDIGLRVRVEQGIGVIRERQVITQLLVLDMGEGRRLAVPLEEVKEILPREAGVDVRPRRRSRDEADGTGEAPVARRSSRSEDDENGDRPVSRRPLRGDDDGNGDASPPQSGPRSEGDETPAPGEGQPQSQETLQGQRPQGSPSRQDPRRGRRDGRPGRQGRPDNRGSRDGGGREGGRREGPPREAGPRDGGNRSNDAGSAESTPPPRPDVADDRGAQDGTPPVGASGAASPQDAGKQDDGANRPPQGRSGRRRRRRRRPQSG